VTCNTKKEDPVPLSATAQCYYHFFPNLITRASKFYGKGPHTSLWAVSQATHGQIAASGVPNRSNYCEIFIVYTYVFYKYGRGSHDGNWRDPGLRTMF
jgi:hypothetical protein